MANAPTGAAQYLARFGEQTIAGSKYALSKLGVDQATCSLKIEEYIILCVPFQLGFKRSIFMASLSAQELAFFKKYANTTIGLSIALNPNKRPEPVKFFLRCNLSNIGPMKDRENVSLFVVDYKSSPDEMIRILGNFLENQERIKIQYEDYGRNPIRLTADVAKLMGYNMFATVSAQNSEPRRIQVFNLSSKMLEHMEAAGLPILKPGSPVTYRLFFQKYRITVNGNVYQAGPLPQGIIRTVASLEICPELVEILDDYWLKARQNNPMKTNPLRQ